MVSNSEWVKTYKYLLKNISSFDSSVRFEIEQAATARIEEEIIKDSESMSGLSKESLNNLDPSRFRAPTPREAFIASIGVLKARLREVPALADKLVEKLDYQASDIQWIADVPEDDLLSEQTTLSLEQLKLTQAERQDVEEALQIIETMIYNQE
ncbi:MAG: hypothetical protein AAGM40_03515 [Cyanobacteria bacterium J06573_2]